MYSHQHLNEYKHIIPDSVPGSPFRSLASRLSSLVFFLLLTACSDFISPVKSTPGPESEYAFNYWLLNNIYLYEDELPNLQEDGDSIQLLYNTLKDPYTTYTPPSQSEDKITHLNTSMIAGDVGIRYFNYPNLEHPIIIDRVYPQSPAGKAGVPRFGSIISVNDIELTGDKAKDTYDSILNYSKTIRLLVAYKGETKLYELQKETIFAPTIFVDTLFEDSSKGYPGIIFITIEGFKPKTVDQDSGSYGELKTYLKSTISDKRVRVLDLRGNLGGHVKQSTLMADLFVSTGILSTTLSRSLNPDGESIHTSSTTKAKAGDPGETGNFIILANQATASAAEIFIAAVTELTDIPLIGSRTFGKGIGQTPFFTYAGGVATITNYQFLTPKGNSYHKVGIPPKYECDNTIGEICAAKIANKLYGVKSSYQDDSVLAKQYRKNTDETKNFEGGAIEWTNIDTYLKVFNDLHR